MTDERTFSIISAWEQFKQVNDARLQEIKRKGHADPLYDEHLRNIGQALDQGERRLDLPDDQQCPASLTHHADASSGYDSAFRTYLRKGMDADLDRFQSKALSAGSDPDGGYLVPSSMAARIVRATFETSPMRQLATVTTISTDALELIDDHDEAIVSWTAEMASVGETATPSLAKRTIFTHELYTQPKATQRLVDDAALDIEAWLSSRIADIFARKENTAFVSGSGVGQPRGLLTYAAGTRWGQIQQVGSGINGAVTPDGLISLFYSLKDAYTKRATFLMNRTTVQDIRLLKQPTTNQYLWQPALSAGAPDTLLGVPVYMAADMPVASPNSLSVAVGDFQAAYQIVDRQGIRILRDPFTEKPFVKFYTTKRVGGDVVNFDALKLLKLAA